MRQYKPKISVVIPAYNEEKFIGKTLRSLKEQDFKDFELIVVDNNSTDKTAIIAKRSGAKVIFEPRQGVGYARQAGFLVAGGEIIATTDADTILPKDWVSRIIKEFENNHQVVAFGGLCHIYSGPLIARILSKIFLVYSGGILWKIRTLVSGTCYLIGSNLAVRKSAFFKIGGFKENLQTLEDGNLSERIKKVGKVNFEPKLLVLTSGRRFNYGLLAGFWHYWTNSLVRTTLKKEKPMKFHPVRDEKPLVGNIFSFALFIFIIGLAFNVFYFHHPLTVQAKVINRTKVKISKEIVSFKTELTEEKKDINNLWGKELWKIKPKTPRKFF